MVAPAGTGKTYAALEAGRRMLDENKVDSTLILTSRLVIGDQWRDIAKTLGMTLEQSVEQILRSDGLVTLASSLATVDAIRAMEHFGREKRWYILVDDVDFEHSSVAKIVDRLLELNGGSRALFVNSLFPESGWAGDADFDAQYFLDEEVIQGSFRKIEIARFSPSFSIIQRLSSSDKIDSLTWREFEKLIAELLTADGYEIELMQGSKDGGVDVVAVMDRGAAEHVEHSSA